MTISWIFIFIFIIAILGQMYFLGQYLSITQNMFQNKSSATFVLGIVAYMTLTLIFFLPFTWFTLNIAYFGIVLLIKDFFTVIFLLIQRDLFHNHKRDYKNLLGMVVAIFVLPLFYKYILDNYLNLEKIEVVYDQQIWNTLTNSLVFLSRGDLAMVETFLLGPISSAIIYAAISSIYYEFKKRAGIAQTFAALVVSIIFVTLFNLGVVLADAIYIGLIICLFIAAYYLIVASRKRYGLLYGLITFIIWTIEANTFWLLILFAIVVISIYVFLGKPRPVIFFIQLFSPILILSAIRLSDISTILSIFITTFSIIFYISIFIIVRINWIEKQTWFFNSKYKFAGFLTIGIITIVIVSILLTNNSNFKFLHTGNQIASNWTNSSFDLFLNISYYVIFGLIIFYFIFNAAHQKLNANYHNQNTQLYLVILITLLSFLIFFNPFIQSIFNYYISSQAYKSAKVFAVAPLFIYLLTKIDLKKFKMLFATKKQTIKLMKLNNNAP